MKPIVPIGGYFEIENALTEKNVTDKLLFNSGRSAFAYLLNFHKIKHVWLPIYNCDVILEPLHELNIKYDFYQINEQLLPEIDKINVADDSVIIINNFFGILDELLARMYIGDRILYDHSQAYYCRLKNSLGNFNSFRKFFGIPDGSSIHCDSNNVDENEYLPFNSELGKKHLYGRKKDGPQNHYHEFLEYEKTFNFNEINSISDFSRQLYYQLDHEYIKKQRLNNFNILHEQLKDKNQLEIDASESVPMTYPLLIDEGSKLKKHLIEQEIFVTTYWPNEHILPQPSSFEDHLMKNLVALPIDQRYGEDEMSVILAQIERHAG